MSAYSYGALLGRPDAPQSAPQMSVTGKGPNNPGPDMGSAASMLTSHSPSVWFLLLLFAAAALARAGHMIR